jgi:hypothetical protein
MYIYNIKENNLRIKFINKEEYNNFIGSLKTSLSLLKNFSQEEIKNISIDLLEINKSFKGVTAEELLEKEEELLYRMDYTQISFLIGFGEGVFSPDPKNKMANRNAYLFYNQIQTALKKAKNKK